MGYYCDFCGEQRSMVYCRSDAAGLCLSCDRNVHSANALSRRHTRTLICERCNSQPALVRCAEEKISLCQSCDWMGHGNYTSAMNHKRQTINCYSGCPSAAELSSLWSFVSDFPSLGESACEQELGLMSIAENSTSSWGPLKNAISQNTSGAADIIDAPEVKSSVLIGTSPMLEQSPVLGQSGTTPLPKLYCHGMKDPAIYEDDELCESLNMDEIELNLENYEELFGGALSKSEELFENGGIESLLGTKDLSAADSNWEGTVAAEVLSGGLVNVKPACSNASADSILSSKTEPILSFTTRQAHLSLSISGLPGERVAGDYQDCGASPLLLMGEPPWCPPCPETSLSSANRSNAVMRYKEKRKTRMFEKRVRYASRKARADVRRRVKGRFVKAGDAYDYDPLSQTRSY